MRILTKLLALLLFLAAPAFADEITTNFAFDGGRGNIGPAEIFAVGPLAVVIAGYSRSFTLADMWEKNEGPGEIGIGLAQNVHHEIAFNEFVQVNLSAIFLLHPESVSVTMSSLFNGESYDVWGSTTPGLRGQLLASDQTNPIFTLPNTFDFISVSGGSADSNVLLNDVTADFRVGSPTPTPEPSTLVLLLTGLVGLTLAARKLGSPTRSHGDCPGL
jgi:hypothetical protein